MCTIPPSVPRTRQRIRLPGVSALRVCLATRDACSNIWKHTRGMRTVFEPCVAGASGTGTVVGANVSACCRTVISRERSVWLVGCLAKRHVCRYDHKCQPPLRSGAAATVCIRHHGRARTAHDRAMHFQAAIMLTLAKRSARNEAQPPWRCPAQLLCRGDRAGAWHLTRATHLHMATA